ncbi:hypothetical protein CesoFtcFv8_010657 [Champsocephalus esox]|uniref:Uncharacterized protein n=1 Tax=Champsocephalus esox TaxID=159716 RepID=A0AAN8C5M7_9TELE|nr:hypothetical protein CesoFtcFv8_010657 [Champsocephalus esox]
MDKALCKNIRAAATKDPQKTGPVEEERVWVPANNLCRAKPEDCSGEGRARPQSPRTAATGKEKSSR